MGLGDTAAAVGRGLFAGAVGTAAMTVSSTLEARIRGRSCSMIAAWAGAATCVSTEQDHPRPWCRVAETTTCLKDLLLNGHAGNAPASSGPAGR